MDHSRDTGGRRSPSQDSSSELSQLRQRHGYSPPEQHGAGQEDQPSGSQSHRNDTALHPEEQSSSGPASEVDPSIIESPNASWYEFFRESLRRYTGFSWTIANDSADNPGASRQRTEPVPDLQESEELQRPREKREDATLRQARENRWRNVSRNVSRLGYKEYNRHIDPDHTEQLNESLRDLYGRNYKDITLDEQKLLDVAMEVAEAIKTEKDIQLGDQRTLMLGDLVRGGAVENASTNLAARERGTILYSDLKKDFLTRLQAKMRENDTKS